MDTIQNSVQSNVNSRTRQAATTSLVVMVMEDSVQICLEEVLDVSDDDLNLGLCELRKDGQGEQAWGCSGNDLQVVCLSLQLRVCTELVDGNRVMYGSSNLVGIEVLHESMAMGCLGNITMPDSLHIGTSLRKHKVSNPTKKFTISLCNATAIGIALIQVAQLHAENSRLDGVKPGVSTLHIVVVLDLGAP